MMVGRETFGVTRASERPATAEGEPLLDLVNVWAMDEQGLPALKDVRLSVKPGEILGIAGVGGNGQAELAQVLSGIRRTAAGKVIVKGNDLTNVSPARFAAAGVGRIPEDRQESIVGELTVAENLALEHLDTFVQGGRLNRQAIRAHAESLIAEFQIKARPAYKARTLSGGNMQKMLLARVLSRQPDLVIAPQPTRGLDVSATDYVRSQLLEQRALGAGVLLISEDLDEVLALSDRIAVMYEGEIVGVLPASEADVETLGLMMCGALREPCKPVDPVEEGNRE